VVGRAKRGDVVIQQAGRVRNLVIVLGDQLDSTSAAFDGFDKKRDAVLQMEVRHEASYVPQHKLRLAYFFASMRHFNEELRASGFRTFYVRIDDPANSGSLEGEIRRFQAALSPEACIVLEPGDWRVADTLAKLERPPEQRADRHFLCSRDEFDAFSASHPKPLMETFYRFMRKKLKVLLDERGHPVGGAWNFDAENRKSFGARDVPPIPFPPNFAPDETTRGAIDAVSKHFPQSPGKLERFNLPVTRTQARAALHDFVEHRLPRFGAYQDAMRGGEPFLYHSLLSGPLNLHRLEPREIIDLVLDSGASAPLNSIEGFVRQIIGWREFVRGTYWRRMPDYADQNALEAHLPMPRFYWTGETDMRCLSEAIGHTIDHAYAHHIERLMVLGLFALLLGVRPYDVHLWHMSMFWDAIDWVSLPNTLGMSQHGDGGIVGTKPYAASGNYINRMSDHCRNCRYDPKQAVGENACPFTTLYWDFLARNRRQLGANNRMKPQYQNLDRKDAAELRAIRRQAGRLASTFY
jgi:deoxyribodipyrimidine photolyase-related protein